MTKSGHCPGPEILRLRVARVIDFGALRQETLTTTLTAARETRATGFRAHPGAETVLTFAGAFRGLVSAFHKTEPR